MHISESGTMGPVLIIEKLVVFFLGGVVTVFLPKYVRAIARCLLFMWIGWSFFSIGLFGEWTQPPAQTVATLMEQVRGDELHWNQFGEPATKWESHNRRNYKGTCQSYAIKQLGKLGPAASGAVPELIQLFKELEDCNSGDGVYRVRSDIAQTLGAIGNAEAIEPMVSLLIMKSLSPDQKRRSSIHWHDREYEDGRSYLKQGTGPQAILDALMLMPHEHHNAIVEQLRSAQAQIEQSELFNDWSKFEIDRGIRFFELDEKTRRRVRRNFIALHSSLDDVHFEKTMNPESN